MKYSQQERSSQLFTITCYNNNNNYYYLDVELPHKSVRIDLLLSLLFFLNIYTLHVSVLNNNLDMF
jgi:hypothetical protein